MFLPYKLCQVLDNPGQKDKCFLCGKVGHFVVECEGKVKRKAGEIDEKDHVVPKKPLQFLNIWTLREYLEYEIRIPDCCIKIDFERIIDDFIFMCFFVGNDFLPNMPTLEIREGAIDLLLVVYKRKFKVLGGYLTDGCKPDLSTVGRFIETVGGYEDKIFEKRARLHQVLFVLLTRFIRDLCDTYKKDFISVKPCLTIVNEACPPPQYAEIFEVTPMLFSKDQPGVVDTFCTDIPELRNTVDGDLSFLAEDDNNLLFLKCN
ncbi:hypothetical protein POM88_010442 [Heracleum sosnowskyi]|uniref:CCHC-type domain-containing protein n=1 Tax=Heracleum sosnowskyi TaxID=360622 RepID=A0AAD8ITH1_9APIA|nr:hypothetical protein POM88_010442 [Heracleum sosnowskyi]